MNSESGMPAPLLQDVIREWKQTSAYNRLSISTARVYRTAEKHLAPLLKKEMRLITERDLFDCGLKLHDKSSMAHMYKAILTQIINHAFERGYIDERPAVLTKAPKTKKRDAWPADDLRSLIRYPGDDPIKQCMFIAFHTAQRIGDILNVKWENYDGKSLEFDQAKTKTKVRVPCSRALKRWLDKQPRTGSFIVQDSGAALSYAQFYYRFRRDYPKGSFPCFHSIRHTSAGNIASMGASAHGIMSITGHKSIASVQRYTRDAEMWEAAKKIMKDYK